MKTIVLALFLATALTLIALSGATLMAEVPITNADNSWLPITGAERRMNAPVVDKSAGVEAIFWRIHVIDDWSGDYVQRVYVHYVRLKVFSEAGKDKAATLEIPYGDKSGIVNIAGRTIKPDGTVNELGRDAIHDRVKVNLGGIRRKVKSFAMPGVEVGSIIEYRWREIQDGGNLLYLRLQFQHEFPVQRATYFIRPLPGKYTTYRMSFMPFNCKPTPMKEGSDGFDSTTLDNVPAFREEPMMPGEANVRPWVLVFYHEDSGRSDPDKYWAGVGRKAYSQLRLGLKTDELRQIAAQAAAGAKDDDEKALRLIGWIRANVRDLWSRQVSDQERAALFRKLPKDRVRTPTEVFKSGIGDSGELNTLFAALAMEAGMDARPALIADRGDMIFNKQLLEQYFLPNIDMAVSIGGNWKIYDVTAKLRPPGMLSWREEGVPVLITDPKNPEFITSPLSPPEASLSSRRATLSLAEDGTLEGDVTEQWTGHAAEERRRTLDGESADRQGEDTNDEILKVYPQAEITALHLENADSPEKLLRLTYHARIPGYAVRTGKRILFQPLFFQHGVAPLFSAAERRYDVAFPYAWRETDTVSVRFPSGFSLEKAENPGNLDFGEAGGYKLSMTVHDSVMTCARELIFGRGGRLLFPRSGYAQVQVVFDGIHRRDEVTLSLRQNGSSLGGAR
jgi:hypothetical protein